ncbi:MAG: PDZ domain-containing protein, partial [Candidatus Methylomirabilales bacterium]
MSRRFLQLLVVAALILPAVAEAATWGWLGVRIRDLSEQEMEEISTRHGIREGYGALIVEVLKETPAARAGLQNGDLVVAFKDRPVVDTRALQRFVAATPAGQEVALTVLRGGEGRRTLRVSVGVMPQEVVAERVAAEFGFVVRDPQEGREAPVGASSGTPTVAVVLRGSPADRAGLKTGDVIVEVNGRPALSRGAVGEALVDLSLD